LLPYYFTDREQELINEEFPNCEDISVDYAILEKAEEIFVFPADFGWSDLGTWGSLHEQSSKDADRNVCIGPNIHLYESNNCIVHTTEEKKVVVQGLDGYIVAEKDNTLLICKLSEEQRIKLFSSND
jgi:mannose-1-phosphate guanylyltransferase